MDVLKWLNSQLQVIIRVTDRPVLIPFYRHLKNGLMWKSS